MNAKISEIFESIQGEGIFVGVRQMFIRFCGCNLNCYYCDTLKDSEFCVDHVSGKTIRNPVSAEYVQKLIDSARVHSISFTGGEPMLQAEFIRALEKTKSFYLESNMSLPEKAKKLRFFDFVAGDLKVREAKLKDYEVLLERTFESFKILRNTKRRRTFCKIVLPSEFNAEEVLNSAMQIKGYVECFVLQPVFGSKLENIFKLQKKMMEFADTRVIPQVHKLMGVK
ncbi:MAG: 7-carboxy-7-deazaguanine synthase QueE [Archaeoglobaceae archaeon]|nr:7-carboxy-7-deazaguanine synthase QueE [Archaeoglobaceae archaeon]MDW8127713.1 7-carboxy-7-deazaguanine synthase QueE [Archaeoglobaceae archaeon]